MYRVDKRHFNISDSIAPNEKSYQDSEDFKEDKQILEKALTLALPLDKQVDRRTGLYIFAELSDAIRFCHLISNSNIYKVASLPKTICYHRGDMNWTEIMNNFLDNEQTLEQMAKLYWQGIKTYKPCWEMIVNIVQVTEIVLYGNQNRDELIKVYRETSGNVERISYYVDTLNRINCK